MDQDERTDLLFEMRDLTEAMKLAQFKQRTILNYTHFNECCNKYDTIIQGLFKNW